MRTKPHLRRCLTRCTHCNIYFLTHPRNAKRDDLGCPFGCRQAHRKRSSTERSVAYYRTKNGKTKKREQNDKRKKPDQPPQNESPPLEQEQLLGKQIAPVPSIGIPFDADLFSYLRMVTSQIEGRRVSAQEILKMLTRALRQHSMVPLRRVDYLVWYLNREPP